jgi:hypothetical protein
MDSPLPERRAVPAGVYETQVVFAMIHSPAYPWGGMLCKGGVRHYSGVRFKNKGYFIDFYQGSHDANCPVPETARDVKIMCPDWALY